MLHCWLQRYHARIRTFGSSLVLFERYWSVFYFHIFSVFQCGEVFRNSTGTFDYKALPTDDIPLIVNCTWVILAETMEYIDLSLLYINIQNSNSCELGSLKVSLHILAHQIEVSDVVTHIEDYISHTLYQPVGRIKIMANRRTLIDKWRLCHVHIMSHHRYSECFSLKCGI